LTAVVDPRRALRIFGLEAGKNFSSKVAYIYKKQLEEAPIILMNKCDTIDDAQRDALKQTLQQEYPQAEIIVASARDGNGLDTWFDRVQNSDMPLDKTMNIDYATYGEGEAQLGWLNAAITVKASQWIDGNQLLKNLADQMQAALNINNSEIAHLKMTLAPEDETGGLAIINLVGNDFDAEASQTLMDDVERGEIIVNIRAEAAPESLEEVVRNAVMACSDATTQLTLDHLERFSPGQPDPVYREGPEA
jgi:G3E family GTPase